MRSVVICLIGLFSLAISPALAADAATQEANKKTVLEFYDAALNRKDFDAAAKYFGSHYIQHNPPRLMASRASRASSASCAKSFRTPAARSSGPSPMATT